MKRKKIEVPANIGEIASIVENVLKPKTKLQKVVDDHYICYGKEVPLCGLTLGNKGIINKIEYITCPKCLEKMKSK